MTDLIFNSNPWALPILMLVVLGLSIEVPYIFGKRSEQDTPASNDTLNTIQSGLFTLAAFVLGISFAQSSARFDARRILVIREANAIGTTWLRADQLGSQSATRFRDILTDYTAARINAYKTLDNTKSQEALIEQSRRDQSQLWALASNELKVHPRLGVSLLVQALNETIDLSAEQLEVWTAHVPTAIVILTLFLVTLATFSAGLRFARTSPRPPFLGAIFVVAFVVVVTMVVDYDLPQSSLVTVSLQPLQRQLESMEGALPNRKSQP